MKSLLCSALGATVLLLAHVPDASSGQAMPAPPTQERARADVVDEITAKDTLSPTIQPGEVAIPNPDYRPARPADVPKAAEAAPRWVPGPAPWNAIN